jgi:hypothetical protein
MSKRDHKTDNATPSRENPGSDFRHLLQTDRMRLPDDTFSALEQLMVEFYWLVQMAKAESKAE